MDKEQEKKKVAAYFHGTKALFQVAGKSLKQAEKKAYEILVKHYGEEYLEELFKDEIEAQ